MSVNQVTSPFKLCQRRHLASVFPSLQLGGGHHCFRPVGSVRSLCVHLSPHVPHHAAPRDLRLVLRRTSTLAKIGPAVRADFRRLYPANAKTSTCCPSDDNRTKVTNSVTSARSLWWHVGPYFWSADLTRTANPIGSILSYMTGEIIHWLPSVLVHLPLALLQHVASWTVCLSRTAAAESAEQGGTPTPPWPGRGCTGYPPS